MKNRNLDHKDHWMTPPDFYHKLDRIYHFDFDPCPLHHDVAEWDGLKCDWGYCNFINPPYSQKLKEAFVKKAVYQNDKFAVACILLLPVSTSTKLFHDYIYKKSSIEFVKGRLRFIGKNDKGQYVNYDQIQEVTKETIEYNDPTKGLIEIPKYIKASGQHDSMIVIF
jgi:hypothetical protein